jgi:hypothetical protein
MTAEQEAKVFEKFSQADASTAQRFGEPTERLSEFPLPKP